MTSVWGENVVALDNEQLKQADEQRKALEALPPELVREGLLFYYAVTQPAWRPYRVLVVDTHNWQTGRNIYFVPVQYEGEVDGKVRKHDETQESGVRKSTIWPLEVATFEAHFHPPSEAEIELFLHEYKHGKPDA